MSELTEKQQRFVEEYLVDLNATQAAIRAGYSEKTATEQGARLLINVKVQDAIIEAKAKRSKRTEITQDRVLQEISRIAFSDIRQVIKWTSNAVTLKSSDELDDDDAAMVSEVSQTTTATGGTLKIKVHDKMKALELAGRHLGLWEKSEAGESSLAEVLRDIISRKPK